MIILPNLQDDGTHVKQMLIGSSQEHVSHISYISADDGLALVAGDQCPHRVHTRELYICHLHGRCQRSVGQLSTARWTAV